MAKVKYYYDSETLSFKQINNRKRRIKYMFFFLFSSFLFALIIVVIFYNINFMQTPKELSLRRELKENEIQFAILNDKMKRMEEVLDRIADRDNTLYRTYFEMTPIPDAQRKSGFGGVNRYEYLEKYSNSEMLIEMTKHLESLEKQLAIQSKSLDDIVALAKEKEKLKSIIHFTDKDKLVEKLKEEKNLEVVILFKGSNSMKLNEVIEAYMK